MGLVLLRRQITIRNSLATQEVFYHPYQAITSVEVGSLYLVFLASFGVSEYLKMVSGHFYIAVLRFAFLIKVSLFLLDDVIE